MTRAARASCPRGSRLAAGAIFRVSVHSWVGFEENGVKITDAKVFVSCPGRNFVTLKLHGGRNLRAGRCNSERAGTGRCVLSVRSRDSLPDRA